MRLLRIDFDPDEKGRIQVELCDHTETEDQNLRYAIFSHRWQKDEVLFADVADPDRALSEATRNKSGFVKLEAFCRIALEHELQHVWIDTCCVDRNSSAEVSEYSNALFEYYAKAELCITYLDDIEDHPKDSYFLDRSMWFSESWNLPALVAPRDLHYYSQCWNKLGTKASLSRLTCQASGVPERVLADPYSLDSICVSEKMSWAARRTTMRGEDRTYSLMGLFGVNMPLLYGEGSKKAFRRLQIEIMRINTDHTIFAWDSEMCTGDMLAPSVSHFINGSDYEMSGYSNIFQGQEIAAERINDPEFRNKYGLVEPRSYQAWNLENRTLRPDFSMTNSGLRIQLPHEPFPATSQRLPPVWGQQRFAFLGCSTKSGQLVAICLLKQPQKGLLMFSRIACSGRTTLRLDPAAYRGRSLPLTDFNPIFISKIPIMSSYYEDRIPSSTQLIRYELWIKSKNPISIATRATAHEHESTRGVHFTPPPPMYNEALPPQKFTECKYAIQHYVNGFMSVGHFDHELVTLTPGKNSLCLAFGECDGFIWIQGSESPKPQGYGPDYYSTMYQNFTFPTGANWLRKEPRFQSLVEVQNGTWKALPVPKMLWTNHTNTGPMQSLPNCHLDVVMERGAPGEMALKIYVVCQK